MTDFDKDRAQKWISKYWTKSKDCIVCGSNQWLILDNVWELRKFERGGLVVGNAPILPVVALMCNVCGQMVFFNAFAVRGIPRDKPEEDTDGSKSS